jgi:hypothetical protein
MDVNNKDPKFYNKNGNLTPYAFACGYIQFASIDGTEIAKWENGKELYLDGNYHVKKYKNGQRVLWESYDTLKEAREVYNSIRIK